MKYAILVLVALVVVGAGGLWLKGCLETDACLDAGGRWDERRGECQYE